MLFPRLVSLSCTSFQFTPLLCLITSRQQIVFIVSNLSSSKECSLRHHSGTRSIICTEVDVTQSLKHKFCLTGGQIKTQQNEEKKNTCPRSCVLTFSSVSVQAWSCISPWMCLLLSQVCVWVSESVRLKVRDALSSLIQLLARLSKIKTNLKDLKNS